jgi:hypothetical protein
MTAVYESAQGQGIGGHHSHKMGTDVWLTPRHILDALGPFDLDPCSAPDPEAWPTAREHITLPTDGLSVPWRGRVWLNPPYGNIGWRWLRRLADHGTGTALLFARTETKGFVETVWNRASAVMFLHGRLHFHHADGTGAKANSGAPSCLVAYGDSDVEKLLSSGLDGTVVLWRSGE